MEERERGEKCERRKERVREEWRKRFFFKFFFYISKVTSMAEQAVGTMVGQ